MTESHGGVIYRRKNEETRFIILCELKHNLN